MRSSILQNIIEIQREAAEISGVLHGCDEPLNWVFNSPGKWPHSIIGTVMPEEVGAIISKIEHRQLPPIWIMENETSAHQIEQLENKGFREINRWKGMWTDKTHFKQTNRVSNKYCLNDVHNPELLIQWWRIIKPIMMPNRNVPPKLLNSWFDHGGYYLLIGVVDKKPVSAGMAYLNNHVAGLYFIATLPEYRGKGYASLLVNELMRICFEKGAEEIILHASMTGRSMYKNLGFIADGSISTYWKVGLF